MNRPAKVGDLDLTVDADEDVLRLDVAVHDVLPVQVLEGCRHLSNILRSFRFREALFAAKMFVEFSLGGELENQEDAFCVVEVTEQLQNVGMGEVGLNFNLSSDLLFNFSLLDLRLVKHFESADETRGALFGKVNTTKLALSERLSNFKHAKMPLLRGGWDSVESRLGECTAMGGIVL